MGEAREILEEFQRINSDFSKRESLNSLLGVGAFFGLCGCSYWWKGIWPLILFAVLYIGSGAYEYVNSRHYQRQLTRFKISLPNQERFPAFERAIEPTRKQFCDEWLIGAWIWLPSQCPFFLFGIVIWSNSKNVPDWVSYGVMLAMVVILCYGAPKSFRLLIENQKLVGEIQTRILIHQAKD